MKKILHTYRIVLVLWICIVQSAMLSGQEVSFKALTDQSKVPLNSTFLIEFRLENAEGKDFRMPDVSPFKIIGGPATSSSLSIINGRRSSSTSWQYSLLATRTGQFTIPAATVKTGSKLLQSNTLTIEVTEARNNQGITKDLSDKDLTFVRLEVTETTAYRGQQLILDYVLYTRQNIESYNILKEPEFEGFYASPVNDLRSQPVRQNIGNKEYVSQVLRRIALYPQKTGKFQIDPAVLELAIPVEGSGGGFFFSRDIRREQITTNSVRIEVKDLPVNAPPSFSGAVGNFNMKASVSKNTCRVNEAVAVRIEIEGDGDPKVVLPPTLTVPENVEYYQPNTMRDENYYTGGRNYLNKVFEYLLVPKQTGSFEISPAFSFFSPQSGKYETIETGPFRIDVLPPDQTKPADDPGTAVEDISGVNRRADLRPAGKSYFGSWWHLSAIMLITVSLGWVIYSHRKRKSMENMDPVLKKRMQARNMALSRMTAALEAKNRGQKRQFFDEIQKALSGYIKDKFNLDNTDLQLHVLADHLMQTGVKKEQAHTVADIMTKCEMAVFAGMDIPMEDMVDRTIQCISGIEEEATLTASQI